MARGPPRDRSACRTRKDSRSRRHRQPVGSGTSWTSPTLAVPGRAGPDRTWHSAAHGSSCPPLACPRPTQEQGTPEARGAFSPNKVAASDALRLNWDSRNLGPNVDMPVMSVASVAPARHSRTNAGFFRRSQVELQGRPWGGERSAWAGPEAASLPTEPSEPGPERVCRGVPAWRGRPHAFRKPGGCVRLGGAEGEPTPVSEPAASCKRCRRWLWKDLVTNLASILALA